jgi:superfamily II DNA or RNA helicase
VSYFIDAIGSITVRPIIGSQAGLRNSQIGALHAISSHFSLRDDPALIVLPTGAGKTAVLMLTPYLLLARRVLIITPSRFVRDHIARDFSELKTLKHVSAVSERFVSPAVIQNKSQVASAKGWEAFRECDVVVSTPNGASPAIKGIPAPPLHLFDLVLVDEAHHSPAPTWNALIAAFPNARVVLFTATPFRRDRKEIRAKYIYTYPIQRAFDDGIYGDMTYIPVTPSGTESNDEALARETEAVFTADTDNGFNHSLMVRADSRPRAKALQLVYDRVTRLRLEVVDSSKSQRTAERAVQRLRAAEIDGVICVDMLGEGFDLPRLKVAALHAPHRSLAVTLQFFGRFARVTGDALGTAKFLAVPSEMDTELNTLFEESDAWGRKIRLIGQERIGAEVEAKEFLEEFDDKKVADSAQLDEDLSLYSFSVFNHVKIHDVFGTVNLAANLSVPGFQIERVWLNEEQQTLVALMREAVRPTWATTPGLDRIEHHLVIIYWEEKSQLLFICSTFREEHFYKALARGVMTGGFKTLSLNKTNRVLRAYSNLQVFNVGIRNRATGTVAESYRQMAGSAPDRALDKGDAALYHRGHLFGRGDTPTGPSTIGVSSLGKVWRLESTKIPDLIKWLRSLARDIQNPAPFTTGISIDHFDAGVDIVELPEVPVLAGDWDESIYKQPPIVTINSEDYPNHRLSLLDFDLKVEATPEDRSRLNIALEYGSFRTNLIYTVGPVPAVSYRDDTQPKILATYGFRQLDLLERVNEEYFRFHLADGSMVQAGEMFAPMGDERLVFDLANAAEPVNWVEERVDIETEFGDCSPNRSIQEWLGERLIEGPSRFVFFDHRPGECADFLAVDEGPDGKISLELYHCKASGGAEVGDRTEDAYEVCGQAVKSTKFRNRKQLLNHVRDRAKSGSRMVKGDLDELLKLLESDPRYEIPLKVVIVQPGMSRDAMTPKIASLLMAVNRGLISLGCDELKLVCSF